MVKTNIHTYFKTIKIIINIFYHWIQSRDFHVLWERKVSVCKPYVNKQTDDYGVEGKKQGGIYFWIIR